MTAHIQTNCHKVPYTIIRAHSAFMYPQGSPKRFQYAKGYPNQVRQTSTSRAYMASFQKELMTTITLENHKPFTLYKGVGIRLAHHVPKHLHRVHARRISTGKKTPNIICQPPSLQDSYVLAVDISHHPSSWIKWP